MLVVTDNGVQLLLKPTPMPHPKLRDALLIAGLFAINGILGFGLSLYSTGIILAINLVILVLSGFLHYYRKRHQPTYLSGGDLLLTSKAFTHTSLGKVTQYQLQATDKVNLIGDTLTINNQQGKTRYQIQGFSDPKQLEVAHAVLNGKTIQTQGKAIRMNDG